MAKKKAISIAIVLGGVFLSIIPSSFGQARHTLSIVAEGYGEKKPVKTVDEAEKVLNEFFKNRNVTVGKIHEKKLFFEADIQDKQGNIIDKVIIDKRTGRIRSTY